MLATLFKTQNETVAQSQINEIKKKNNFTCKLIFIKLSQIRAKHFTTTREKIYSAFIVLTTVISSIQLMLSVTVVYDLYLKNC